MLADSRACPIFILISIFFGGSTVQAIQDVHSFSCGGVDMKLTEKELFELKDCGNQVGVTSKMEMTMDKMPVDKKGVAHKENVDNMLSDKMTDQIKAAMRLALTKCLDEHIGEVEPNDETCGGYTSLALCIHMAYTEVCYA